MNRKAVVLTVEDDIQLLNSNRLLLESEGYDVLDAKNIAQARQRLTEKTPDLIVLDIKLPDGSGLDFLGELRRTSAIPVLLLTSLDTDDDMIRGFDIGGDDYLTKPFDVGVFLKRIAAILRRTLSVPEIIAKGALALRLIPGRAFLHGKDMLLPQKEFALLAFFAQHEDETLATETIYEKVWGQPMNEDANAVRFSVSRLRKKLKGSGYTITAEYGEGYRFERA